ncbi:MAG: spore coat protein CotJB [Clostridiales bacterium]|nr:spore coat protein CotJB [Clostridiales bacterium]
MNRDELLQQITALDFYIIDLHLYLNTHPNDGQALELYNASVRKVKELREEYTQRFGMLLANNTESRQPWQWIDDPWPWQRAFNFNLGEDMG